jgi:hypothetical protein
VVTSVPRGTRGASRGQRAVALLGLLAAAGAHATPVSAQEPSVRAFLTPASGVGVGRPFVLNVEISGTQEVQRQPTRPDLSSFAEYLGSNTQSSVSMVNGRTTVSLTIQYRYQAVTEGSHRIPAFDVAAGGRTFTTDPLDVTVSANPTPDGTDPTTGLALEDLFITVEPERGAVREGEPFVVEYRIWTRVDVTNFGVTRVPEPEGFWVEDLTPGGQPEVEQRVRDGVQYATALIRRIALVPDGSGSRAIDPVGIEAQVRVRRGRDPFQDFFGRSSLFGTSSVTTTVLSNPLVVDVQPLPAGRPDPFSGIVGSLSIEASLDRDSVDASEAVTLTVRMSGEGNVRAIPVPELGLPEDFEVFPPEVSERVSAVSGGLAGTKTFEWVLIPRAPGNREVPPVEVGYFDTEAGAYRMASSRALPLTVSGDVIEGPAAMTRGGIAQLREDIRFIRLGSLELRATTGGSLFAGAGFWLFLLLPMAGVAGAVALRRHQDLLAGDAAYARGRQASRVARRRLAEARRLAEGDDARAFYAEVARALRGLVADRLNLAEAGLRMSDVDQALLSRGVEEHVREDVRRCLEHCDRQRFAPPGGDPEEKSRFLDRTGELMTTLDRAIR